MTLPHATRQRGIALIIVMTVVAMLGILAGGFAYAMKIETKLARNQDDDSDLEWLGRSGVELAKYVLAIQMTIASEPYDALNQKWAGGVGITNEILAEITLENNPLGPGFFSIRIIDQERKFNINSADPMILQQAMILLGVDAADSPTIVDSIMDWRDPDDARHLSGAESEDYLALSPPYYAKNGPIDDISELLLINGVTPALYGGTNDSSGLTAGLPSPTPVAGSLNNPISPGGVPSFTGGLKDLFCALSGPQININTAPAHVLQLVPGMDPNVAQGVLMLRAGPDGVEGNEDDVPFRNPGEIINVPGINRQFAGQLARYFTTRSTTFEVQVEATIGHYRRQYVAMLRRVSPRDVQVLYFHPK
jgi:general secretion pathway protein K